MSAYFMLCVSLVILAGSVTSQDAPPQCHDLDIKQCLNLGYNMTSITEEEQWKVIEKMSVFEQIAGHSCSAVLTPFLCFSVAPKCRPDIPYPIRPCRETCEKVKEQCSDALAHMLVGWADDLACSNYEAKGGDKRCMSYGKLEKLLAASAAPIVAPAV